MALLATSLPALADRTTVRIEDEDTLLVGEPTGLTDVHVEQTVLGRAIDGGTYKAYGFTVEAADNRLEVDLRYEAGKPSLSGPCMKANELDLYVEGPDWSRTYPGCDDGNITVLADGVPTGDYTVRVDAERGTTACLVDDVPPPCSSPGIEYHLVIEVRALG